MPKYLLLDVDGVLVTGRPSDRKPWYSQLQSDLGIDIGLLSRDFFKIWWPEIVVGRLDLMPTLQKWLHQANIATAAHELIDYWFAMDSNIDQEILAQCDALRARGALVYLATNQDHLRANYLTVDMKLSAHLDGIFYSAQLGVAKPDPDFYQLIVEALGTNPAEIFFIDDTLKNVSAARQVGWQAHHWQATQPFADVIAGRF